MKTVKSIQELKFAEEDKAIDMHTYLQVMHYFDKNLVMGIELERNMGSRNSGNVTLVSTKLDNAGRFMGSRVDTATAYRKSNGNKYNVAYVKSDMSVTDGVEVIFGGCNERFTWVRQKLMEIEKVLNSLGAKNFCRSSSNHISFLTLQDKILSPTIIKNIFNLTRAFAPALYWLGAGDSERIHRGGHYCKPNFSLNPIGRSASDFLGRVGKYSQCNCGKTPAIELAGREFTSGLYVEFRHIDGIRVPSALTANAFMLRALIYKALSISRKGVLKVESMGEWDKSKAVTERLLSQSMNDEDIVFVHAKTKEMLDFLVDELKSMCSNEIPMLYELARKPVYIRSGNWNVIEKSLKVSERGLNITPKEEKFLEIVLDGLVSGKTIGEWKAKVAKKMGSSERMVEYMMKNISMKIGSRLIFDNEIKNVRVD